MKQGLEAISEGCQSGLSGPPAKRLTCNGFAGSNPAPSLPLVHTPGDIYDVHIAMDELERVVNEHNEEDGDLVECWLNLETVKLALAALKEKETRW